MTQYGERTLVILKPDAVRRGLIGHILERFERAELVVERLIMMRATAQLVSDHYPSDENWLTTVGNKTLADFSNRGLDPLEVLGTTSAVDIGSRVKAQLVAYLSEGDIVVAVIGGNRAIECVRKIVGGTIPISAAPGTIRGDLSADSPDLAANENRPVRNLIHASGDAAEAEREISLWFAR